MSCARANVVAVSVEEELFTSAFSSREIVVARERGVSLCAAYRYLSHKQGQNMRVIKDSFLLQGLLTRQKSRHGGRHDQKFTPFWRPSWSSNWFGNHFSCSFQFTTSGAQGTDEHDQKWTPPGLPCRLIFGRKVCSGVHGFGRKI